MERRTKILRWLAIVALLSLSCNFGGLIPPPPTEEATETPTSLPATPTDTTSPTPKPPTPKPPTPTATLEPAPLPAPRLLFRTPEQGETLALESSIALTFDQPMDQASVAQAFSISPAVPGDLSWRDTRTLEFTPGRALRRGESYRVTVADSAQNVEGKALMEPVQFAFETVGYLSVSEVQPAPGSANVEPDTTVTVVFNRPVVPLGALSRRAELPDPLAFEPPVAGEGEWLNTSIYRFVPDEGFLPATTYVARIAAGLSDTQGSILEEDYIWVFTTLSPALVRWQPNNNAEHVAPGEVISVTFNQPMARASVEEAFNVQVGGEAVAGEFRWSREEDAEEQAHLAKETVAFVPAAPLPRGATVRVEMLKSAHARNSDVTLVRAYDWSFTVAREPGIRSTSPQAGDTDVPVHRDVRIEFESPMDPVAFAEHLTVIPGATQVYSYWWDSDTQMRLSFPKEAQTSYTVRVDSAAPGKFGLTLGEALNLRFTTGDLDPYVNFKVTGNVGTFSAYTETVVFLSYRNVSQLNLALYRLTPESFMQLHGFGSYQYRDDYVPHVSNLLREWSITPTAERNVTGLMAVDMTSPGGEQLPTGIYYLTLTAPETRGDREDYLSYTFIRSYTNLVLKQAEGEALVWATDLASGQPLAGLPVRLYTSETPAGYPAGAETNREGIYLYTPENKLSVPSPWEEYFAITGEPGERAFAVAFNNWDSGIRPWDFDLRGEYGSSDYVNYLYTDRPIYRPDQTVYFKGIVRADDDAAYALPTGVEEVLVEISDPQGKQLYEETLPLNDMGTFHGELHLDESAPLGTYFIQVSKEKRDLYAGTSFRVAEYRKPEFQVGVTTDEDAYLNGERANVNVAATYYFGGPVASANVEWHVLSADYYFNYQCPRDQTCPRYSWRDYEDAWGPRYGERYGGYGHLVTEGELELDEQGRATFNVPADISEEVNSRVFTFEATVTDINDQAVSNRTTAVVHKGEFYVGVAPQGRLGEAGEEKSVALLVADWESEPVADVELQVVFMEHRWYSVYQEDESGRTYWTWDTEDIPVYTTTVSTDAQGQAEASFTPERSGTYRVRATAYDEHENEIRSSAYVWVWGGGRASWRRESTNRINLVVDRDEYQVGDVAEILVPSPYEGPVRALVTIERGHFFETQVIELQSNSEVLRIPILESYVPNVFVSVVLMQGSAQAPEELASFKMGEVLLPIAVDSKTLNITLEPDIGEGEHYNPRDEATYNVRVTDHAGEPVEAELSLRLADLAVLALADERGPTLVEHYWSQRGLGVRTSTPLAVAMEAFNRELAPGLKGGGGGAAEEGGFIRERFADTAFWDPVVRTDAEGRAQVKVRLPDNLTTWRMQARGITAETLVGRAEVDVVSTLDLLVRPVLPRFFVVGDQADIATIVHNNTDETLDTEVTLTTTGLEVAGSDDGILTREVTVAAGEKVRVNWPVTVRPGNEVTVQMEAAAGDIYDGRKDTLPVYTYSTPEVVATAGRLSNPEERHEIVQLPYEYDPTQGELTVQVDGSLTAATQDSLRYLEHFPYECVEQTVSRFLPNVLTYQTLNEMGLERPEMEEALRSQIAIAFQRIYNQQNNDGGWGWWRSDRSNPYLTAYVLQGLLEAQRAGFTVDDEVLERGVAYLREQLLTAHTNMPAWQANRLAYQLYVLGEYLALVPGAEPAGELGRAVTLFEQRRLLSDYGQATLAVALGLLEPQEDFRVNTLLSDLAGDAVYSATGTHWEEEHHDYRNMNTNVRSTAIVLWAFARHNPTSDLLPNVVRWLMSVREANEDGWFYWESTNTTAWSLIGLTAYMRASGELQGDFNYTVTLNGDLILEGTVDEETIDESREVQVEIARLLADQANRLIIERHAPTEEQSGAGQLYYTAHLRYFIPAEDVLALDRGISVARQYSPVDDPEGYVESAQVGDLIRVKLTVVAPTDLYYVIVEDPLPAGFEAVDVQLKTTSVTGEAPTLRRNLTSEEESFWYRWFGWGWWWFSHSELRDEKVALFASYLPRGTYEYTYVMRASVPGRFNVIPTTASEMYFPEVWGRSDGGVFVVRGE